MRAKTSALVTGLLLAPGLLAGKHDAAVDAYRKAVALNPRLVSTIRNPEIRKELREQFLADARGARAEARLPDAERLYLLAGNFGEGFKLYMELGEVYLQMEAWSKAVVVFKKAIVANPGNPAAMASLATAYHKAGHPDVSAQFFARALSLDVELFQKISLPPKLKEKVRAEIIEKAHSLLTRSMPLDAAGKLDLALALREDAELRLTQGRAYMEAGDSHAAARAYALAVDLDAGLQDKVPEALRKDAGRILYTDAVKSFQEKALPRAKHLFQRSLLLDATARTLYNLANIYVHAGKLDEALGLYADAVEKDPNLDEARLNRAMVQIEKGLLQNAISDLKELVAVNPRRAEAYDLIAQAYSKMSKPTKAFKVYQAAINFDPALAEKLGHKDVRQAAALGFFEDARTAFEARDFQEVVELCKKANVLHPNPRAYYLMGNARFAMDDAGGAIPAYEKALELAPDHAATLNNMGNAFLKLKDYARAADTFRRTVRVQPGYAQAYNNLGIALRKAGKLQEAIEAYKKALEIDPNYAAAYFNLGNAYQEVRGS